MLTFLYFFKIKAIYQEFYHGNPLVISLNSKGFFFNHDEYHFYNCIFQSMSFRPITLFTDFAFNVLIEETFFNNCTCLNEGHGGAIYFDCSNAALAMNKVCVVDCFSGNNMYGQMGYFVLSNLKSTKFNYISINKCSNTLIGNRYSPIYFMSGRPTSTNINVSRCLLQREGSFHLFGSGLFLTLSNFLNNQLSQNTIGGVILHSGPSCEIRNCNFIGNGPSTSLIYSYQNAFVYNSIFIGNSGPLFSGTGLFVYTSVISHSGSPTAGALWAYGVSSGITNTYMHQHFMTALCNADFPFIQSQQSSYIPTPLFQEGGIICQTLPPIPSPAQTVFDSTIHGKTVLDIFRIMELFLISLVPFLWK